MQVKFPVAPSLQFTLQASTNLTSWTNLWVTAVETTNGWVEYDETFNSSIRAKFYRLAINTQIVAPTLGFQKNGLNLILTWSGTYTLQTATNAIGPFTDVSLATSPYTNSMISDPRRFFRLRSGSPIP